MELLFTGSLIISMHCLTVFPLRMSMFCSVLELTSYQLFQDVHCPGNLGNQGKVKESGMD